MGTPIFSLNTDVHSEKAAHISYRAKTRSTFLKKKKNFGLSSTFLAIP